MKRNLSTQWTKHLDVDKKESFEKLLRTNVQVFTVLRSIQQSEIDDIGRRESSIQDFEDGNWANKQAYRNGYKAALNDQLRLTDFIEG